MANTDFFVDYTINMNGSGLGFYRNSFGQSITQDNWQGKTFITNSNGTVQGAEADNVKYSSAQSGIVGGGGSPINIQNIPNTQATLRISFTHPTAVQTLNSVFRAYDRSNINNAPSGITVAAAEIIHPDPSQATTGSGDTSWSFLAGSSIVLNLAPSPGSGGHYAGDGNDGGWSDMQHDYFIALSVKPTSAGTKLFGLYFETEYL